MYLPEYQVCTIFHMKEINAGDRLIILAKDVQIISIPQFEGLSIEKMLEFASPYPDVAKALPSEEREVMKLHRQYISNVIFTLVGEPF